MTGWWKAMASTAIVATRPLARANAARAGGDVHLRQEPAAEDVPRRVGVGRHRQRAHGGLETAKIGHGAPYRLVIARSS
jgi:hypothetical protein